MAITNFYIGSSGSNVNAGSTTGASAAYTSTNGNWNGSTVFTPTDGSTPASSISVGDYVSIYLDAATITTFVAQVTNVAAGVNGAITVSGSIVYGTAPSSGASGRSIKAGGQWSSISPLTTSGMGTFTVPQSTKVNVKQSSYVILSSFTIAIAGSGTNLFWMSGYNTTPGDLDNDTTNSLSKPVLALSSGNSLTVSGADVLWTSISGTANVNSYGFLFLGNSIQVWRSRFENTNSGGSSCAALFNGAWESGFYCWFKAPTTSAIPVCYAVGGVGAFVGCVAEGGGLCGFSVAGATNLVNCIALNNTGIGISCGSAYLWISYCTVYNSSGDGIKWTGASGGLSSVIGCLLSNCGGYGINNSSGNLVSRACNDFYSCTSGNEHSFGDYPAFFGQTDSSAVVTSSTNMTPVSSSNAINNGFPGIFENETFSGFTAIGAVQPKGGGGFVPQIIE